MNDVILGLFEGSRYLVEASRQRIGIPHEVDPVAIGSHLEQATAEASDRANLFDVGPRHASDHAADLGLMDDGEVVWRDTKPFCLWPAVEGDICVDR
jgi:hypothetical protein